MTFQRKLTIAALTLSAALPLTLAPTLAQAATRNQAVSAPRVESFNVDQVNNLAPGTELEFTLIGTPGAAVELQIAGAKRSVALNEVRPGRYEGGYTVRSRDHINASSLVTARLTKAGQVSTVSLSQSLVAGAQAADTSPNIATFRVTAPEGISPGDDLHVSMTGAPGGRASASIKGVATRIALTEVSRGVYDGTYTVRRKDRVDDSLSSTGSLVLQDQENTQRYERGQEANNAGNANNDGNRYGRERADRGRAVVACSNCGVVEAVNVVEVKGGQKNVIGTIAGGVLGGVLGHQVGDGTGRDLATIAGAVGGAYAGNRAENSMNRSLEYQVVVRLENGSQQTFTYSNDLVVQVGARVKVENQSLVRL